MKKNKDKKIRKLKVKVKKDWGIE
jgi:hypothetical protein